MNNRQFTTEKLRLLLSAWVNVLSHAVQDFSQGRVFWIPVVTAILPVILAALAISSHGSRLVAAVEVNGPIFRVLGTTFTSSYGYDPVLFEAIENSLIAATSFPFRPDSDTVPSPSPGGPRSRDAEFPEIDFFAHVKVTNIGAKPSSLAAITYYIVEATRDGRDTLTYFSQPSDDIPLPEGRPVALASAEGQKLGVWGGAVSHLVDYRTVNILREKLDGESLQTNKDDLLSAYLRLLGRSNRERQVRLLRLADQQQHSQIIVGVEVIDIYGRSATAEKVVMDSTLNWLF